VYNCWGRGFHWNFVQKKKKFNVGSVLLRGGGGLGLVIGLVIVG